MRLYKSLGTLIRVEAKVALPGIDAKIISSELHKWWSLAWCTILIRSSADIHKMNWIIKPSCWNSFDPAKLDCWNCLMGQMKEIRWQKCSDYRGRHQEWWNVGLIWSRVNVVLTGRQIDRLKLKSGLRNFNQTVWTLDVTNTWPLLKDYARYSRNDESDWYES